MAVDVTPWMLVVRSHLYSMLSELSVYTQYTVTVRSSVYA